MREQFTMFPPSEAEIVRNAIKKAINDVLIENWLDGLECSEERLKATTGEKWSYKFNGVVIAQIYWGKVAKYINVLGVADGGDIKLDLNTHPRTDTVTDLVGQAARTAIERIPKAFSCCSHYAECSDAMRCVHPDKDFALGCFYRKQMARGKVFYGKNRNID